MSLKLRAGVAQRPIFATLNAVHYVSLLFVSVPHFRLSLLSFTLSPSITHFHEHYLFFLIKPFALLSIVNIISSLNIHKKIKYNPPDNPPSIIVFNGVGFINL